MALVGEYPIRACLLDRSWREGPQPQRTGHGSKGKEFIKRRCLTLWFPGRRPGPPLHCQQFLDAGGLALPGRGSLSFTARALVKTGNRVASHRPAKVDRTKVAISVESEGDHVL